MKITSTLSCLLIITVPSVSGYAFSHRTRSGFVRSITTNPWPASTSASYCSSSPAARAVMPSGSQSSGSRSGHCSLQMVDQNVILGAAVAAGGLALGVGLVAFTEVQGERAKQRGGGLSESMSTRIASGLIEDVEVSSVADLGTLTSQLEKALKEGGADVQELELSEQDKKRRAAEADDGW